jgi:hypothetical protein
LSIELEKLDSKYQSGLYYILVVPLPDQSFSVVPEFMMSYTVGSHSVNLLDGSPVKDVVKKGYYSYFNYVYTGTPEDIVIKLTTIHGDADIFISTKSNIKFPTKIKNDFASTSTRESDEIEIPATSLPKKCLNLTFDQGMCTLHIGVYSDETYDSSSFSISATRRKEIRISQLLDGVPQKETLKDGMKQFYYFKASKEKDIQVVLVPTLGNTDLYISIILETDVVIEELPWPSKTDYDLKSTDSIGADTAYVTGDILAQCGEACLILITVVSNDDSKYTLTLT